MVRLARLQVVDLTGNPLQQRIHPADGGTFKDAWTTPSAALQADDETRPPGEQDIRLRTKHLLSRLANLLV